MRLFRVRTIPTTDGCQGRIQADLLVEAADLTLARRKADRIARSVPTWREGDRIEIASEAEELLATRRAGRSWRTFRQSAVPIQALDHKNRRT